MYTIKIFDTNHDKKYFSSDIHSIFERNFSRKMSNFEHLFLDNPLGSIVIAAFDAKKQLVGLGHIVLLSFYILQKEIKFFLFTTSIVDEKYRKTRMYFDILDKIKEEGIKSNVDFLLAFPNSNALPILTTFGGFKKLNTLQWLQLDQLPENLCTDQNIFDTNFLGWRFSRFQYFLDKIEDKNIIYKNYQGKIDILGVFDNNFPQKILPPRVPIDNSKQIIIADTFLKSKKIDSKNIIHTNQVVVYPINSGILNLSCTPIFSDVF